MRFLNSLRLRQGQAAPAGEKKVPTLLCAAAVVLTAAYFRVASVDAFLGDADESLLGTGSLFFESGLTTFIAAVLLFLSLIRRERFWPVSVLILLPVAGYTLVIFMLSSRLFF